MLLAQVPTPPVNPPPTQGRVVDAVSGQPMDVAMLQSRLTDLQTRLDVLNAQRVVLVDRTRSDNPAIRANAEQSLMNLDLDAATVRAQVASLKTQIAQAGDGGGVAGVTVIPPTPPIRPVLDPDAVTAVFVMTAIAILVPLSVGITRRLWRRAPDRSATSLEDKISPRLDRLEQAVDSIAIEVERISEAQRFVAKVLSERPAQIPPAPPPVDAASLGEATPFLALGAGPLEPIRAPERQGVKQSITPH
jgi:hypothetical protein